MSENSTSGLPAFPDVRDFVSLDEDGLDRLKQRGRVLPLEGIPATFTSHMRDTGELLARTVDALSDAAPCRGWLGFPHLDSGVPSFLGGADAFGFDRASRTFYLLDTSDPEDWR